MSPFAGIQEHQVDVGAVVQFAAAEFAECDDGEASGLAGFRLDRTAVACDKFVTNAGISNLQNGIGQVR